MQKQLINTLILLILTQALQGQLQFNWQQCYGSMDSDQAWDIAKTEDGYIVVGSQDGGDGQVTCSQNGSSWLLKIDEVGNLQWQLCFDSTAAFLIEELSTSSYSLIGAGLGEPYPDTRNLWISRMDSTGNILWEKILGSEFGTSNYGGYGGFITNDGGVIACVIISKNGGDITNWYGMWDGWVVKVDSLGNKEWDVTIGSSRAEFINGVIKTLDNGCMAFLNGSPDGISGNLTCSTNSPTKPDAIVYKIDSSGNQQWHNCYGGSEGEGAVTGLSLNDGYLIAAGGSSTDGDMTGGGWHPGYHHTGDRTMDVWLIRTNLSGEIIWQKCYGGSGSDSPREVFQTSDGGFIVFSNTDSQNGDVIGNPSVGNHESIWAFKIDSIGNLEWQQCIGGHARESVNSVLRESDNKYTVAGRMSYSPSGDVNCSNFIYGSSFNYWLLSITDIVTDYASYVKSNDIIIFPNPTSGLLNIELTDNIEENEYIITICDLNGYEVLRKKHCKTCGPLSLNNFSKGMYVLRIVCKDEMFLGKLIIN